MAFSRHEECVEGYYELCLQILNDVRENAKAH
jgi:hypothetical protein